MPAIIDRRNADVRMTTPVDRLLPKANHLEAPDAVLPTPTRDRSVHGDLAALHVEREARGRRAVAVVLRPAGGAEPDERRHVGGAAGAGAVVLHLPPGVEP